MSSPVTVSGADCKSVVFGLLSSNLRAPTKVRAVSANGNTSGLQPEIESSILLWTAKISIP